MGGIDGVRPEEWLTLEQGCPKQGQVEDPRIDMCLFCIGPHRLRPSDLKFMYEIGLHVPIVPIVTKADTMTIREATMYRAEVANRIANPMLPGIRDKINVFQFDRDSLRRAGIPDSGAATPPFLVVASNDVNEELNSGETPLYWPERRYPWGTAEAFNKDHSDLLSLRSLLLKEALEDVLKSKRSRYEAWRRGQLRQRSGGLGRFFRRAAIFTIVPALVALKIGRSDIKMDDVKRTVSAVGDRAKALAKRLPHLPARQVVEVEEVEEVIAAAPAKRGWF
ncbi:hypothetical protein FOA52_001686 [Chlamydomonas sp. UWO 241]|nr:hypothetical protein FOA52_001686 [Chlamydomonas sp. UWO 241]